MAAGGRAYLFGVGPLDIATYASIVLIVTVVAIIAVCGPALRASRTVTRGSLCGRNEPVVSHKWIGCSDVDFVRAPRFNFCSWPRPAGSIVRRPR